MAGRGGHMPGAGRKPLSAQVMLLRGGRNRTAPRRADLAVSKPVEMPSLPAEVAAVWAEFAPHAIQAGTLTDQTVSAFVRLCELVVWHHSLEAVILADGLTSVKVTVDGAGQEHRELKAHPLLVGVHSAEQVIRSGMKDFMLHPFGRPVAVVAEVKDPFAEFDVERHG